MSDEIIKRLEIIRSGIEADGALRDELLGAIDDAIADVRRMDALQAGFDVVEWVDRGPDGFRRTTWQHSLREAIDERMPVKADTRTARRPPRGARPARRPTPPV